MKGPIKHSIYLMLAALVLQLFPLQTIADTQLEELKIEEKEFILFAEKAGETAKVYEDITASRVIGEIEDDSLVFLLEEQKGEEFSLIRYKAEEEAENKELVGYIKSDFLVPVEEAEEIRNNRQADELNNSNTTENDIVDPPNLGGQQGVEEVPKEADHSGQEDELFEEENPSTDEFSGEELKEAPEHDETKTVLEEEPSNQNTQELEEVKRESAASLQKNSITTFSATEKSFSGVALKNKTNVYNSQNHSKVLKSYKQGHILKFRSHPNNSNLYAATVILKGKKHDGVIHKNDVDLLVSSKALQGFAAVEPLHVYSSPDKKSTNLKSYRSGSALKYQAFSTQWNKATVYVNGKPLTGYIHTNDVKDGLKPPINSNAKLKGVAKKSPTAVYSSQSTSSKKLKTYAKGHILIYSPYNSNWHSATVYINGKAETGYIHVSHVETAQSSIRSLKGIALNSPTRIYSKASTSSTALKSYSQGHLLSYRTFSKDWYEATVYVNRQKKTGYIYKGHVENIVSQQKTIRGAALKSPTKVYAKASTGAKTLKSYRLGHGLVYRTLTNNWYQATVIINGKKQTGYIHKNDVASLAGRTIVLDPGHGGHDPGTQALGLVEKELNLDIGLRAEKLLKNAGAKVIMTRSTDVFVTLPGRSKIANSSGADIFVSIHGNSFNGAAKGVETFWYGKYEKQNSERLAHSLQDRVVPALGLIYRRVAPGDFHVIRETKIPSALVEVGFLDHPGDAEKLRTATYRQRAAEGILLGIIDYF